MILNLFQINDFEFSCNLLDRLIRVINKVDVHIKAVYN